MISADTKKLKQTEEFSVSCCLHWEHRVNSGISHRSECIGGALQVTVVTVTVTLVEVNCRRGVRLLDSPSTLSLPGTVGVFASTLQCVMHTACCRLPVVPVQKIATCPTMPRQYTCRLQYRRHDGTWSPPIYH